jgi:nucleoside-diphosphate-sugar epimerase
MAKYLITGAAGFIGSSLVRSLLERGEQVRGIDNFSTGRRENLAEVLKQIDFREADILDLDAMHNACKGVDYVLHQAAIPSVPKSVLDPLGSNRANIDGTVNVLVAARDAKVRRVVYADASEA